MPDELLLHASKEREEKADVALGPASS